MSKFHVFFQCLVFVSLCSLSLQDEQQQDAEEVADDTKAANDEVYSSMASLEQLLPTEAVIVTSLQSYISSEEMKLEEVRRFAANMQAQNTLANKNKQKYLSNPINAFLLIKRLTMDWSKILEMVQTNNFESFLDYLSGEVNQGNIKIPSAGDPAGAAMALHRLQHIYDIPAASLANGIIRGVNYSSKMTADDCLGVGLELAQQWEHAAGKEWMLEALKRWELEEKPGVTKEAILEHLAWCNFYIGDIEDAMDATTRLMEINPQDAQAKVLLETIRTAAQQPQNLEHWAQHDEYTKYKFYYEDEMKPLCRGEGKLPEDLQSQLRCFYHKPKENKFLLIAPIKVEEAYKSPQIWLVHDIMSDAEIEWTKSEVQSNLVRAGVIGDSKDKVMISPDRIGKVAWLIDEEHPELVAINKRLEDMTGLIISPVSAESLQVANYGMGGHYLPHEDSFNSDLNEEPVQNEDYVPNRIATVLIYMSEVEQGGATVFPRLGVSVQPKKGAAVFWYNLHSNLSSDSRTLHAACPVLVGYKWVSNKWILDAEQVFRKPCDLQTETQKL